MSSTDRLLEYFTWYSEATVHYRLAAASVAAGRYIGKSVYVMDMRGFGIGKFGSDARALHPLAAPCSPSPPLTPPYGPLHPLQVGHARIPQDFHEDRLRELPGGGSEETCTCCTPCTPLHPAAPRCTPLHPAAPPLHPRLQVMEKTYIVHAPWVFQKVWGFVAPLLDPRTASKFVILGGPSEFLPRLQAHLDIDDLPEFLGGKDTSCDFVREVGPWAEYVPALK